jgi:hypothetical protein
MSGVTISVLKEGKKETTVNSYRAFMKVRLSVLRPGSS